MNKEKVYFTISRSVDPTSHIYQFITVVEDEDIAKDLCNKNPGWIYSKQKVETKDKGES